MSNQGFWGGYNLPILIVVLGILFAFLVDLIIFIAFVAVLGYYLYRVEKRLSELEGPGSPDQQAKKPK